MSRENWLRSYKVVIGVPEYEEDLYKIDVTSVLKVENLPKISDDATTIPSDAVSYSNLVSEGNNIRGFTFKLDSTRVMSEGSSDGTEKTTLTMYNLDKKTISLLQHPRCVVRIYAGYDENISLAYSGDVSKMVPTGDGTDKVYQITCVDGLAGQKNTIVNIDYEESVSVADMIIDLGNRFPDGAMGVSGLSHLSETYITGGMTFMGTLARQFDKMLRVNNLSYSRFNGKMVITPYRLEFGSDAYDEMYTNNYDLTSDLIKSIGEANDNGDTTDTDVKVKTSITMNTFYIPIELGQFFTVPSGIEGYAGTYQVTRIRTKLESQGASWDVALTGAPI